MRKINVGSIVTYVMIIVFYPSFSSGMTLDNAIETIADKLHEKQVITGVYAGCWPPEYDFTGSIVGGMASAHELACDEGYLHSSELGGDSILFLSQGNFFGDETYALMLLSQNSTDPNDNKWRDALVGFYDNVENSEGGTKGYIENSSGSDPSTDVLYLAHYVLAAYYVNANDKQIWRQELVGRLSYVDDTSFYPVMALGAALWALSKTGPVDTNTPIEPTSGQSLPYWNTKKFSDLPTLLVSHQVQGDQANGAGSFYWQFTHTPESLYGYTEDAIFATLGLAAAYQAEPDANLYSAIVKARKALLNGVNPEGRVFESLSQEGVELSVYSGEMLEILVELISPGDVDGDGKVGLKDFDLICNHWGEGNCNQTCWCDHADINRNGQVDTPDLEIFCDNWLREEGY